MSRTDLKEADFIEILKEQIGLGYWQCIAGNSDFKNSRFELYDCKLLAENEKKIEIRMIDKLGNEKEFKISCEETTCDKRTDTKIDYFEEYNIELQDFINTNVCIPAGLYYSTDKLVSPKVKGTIANILNRIRRMVIEGDIIFNTVMHDIPITYNNANLGITSPNDVSLINLNVNPDAIGIVSPHTEILLDINENELNALQSWFGCIFPVTAYSMDNFTRHFYKKDLTTWANILVSNRNVFSYIKIDDIVDDMVYRVEFLELEDKSNNSSRDPKMTVLIRLSNTYNSKIPKPLFGIWTKDKCGNDILLKEIGGKY